ncbi:hypothetical protein G205_23172 [Arthrobacter nitrophenolicus]|uniref:Uncharacterized protein n=1 Tax=Arthrobacter nitrophenolicus TaxID=683150 RepID=L8TIU5_9MICC|nr:hypothetical protein G205_23172 [Arthrobacter nitrophenolicus]
MVCQKLSPDVTDSAPKDSPYSPVAMLMEIPTRTAGDPRRSMVQLNHSEGGRLKPGRSCRGQAQARAELP